MVSLAVLTFYCTYMHSFPRGALLHLKLLKLWFGPAQNIVLVHQKRTFWEWSTGWFGPSLFAYRLSWYCSICQQTANAQIRLHRYAYWSGPTLPPNNIRALFCVLCIICFLAFWLIYIIPLLSVAMMNIPVSAVYTIIANPALHHKSSLDNSYDYICFCYRCPYYECKSSIPPYIIQQVLTKEQFQRYETLALQVCIFHW